MSFSWDGGEISLNIAILDAKTERAITTIFHFQGDRSTVEMKTSAPWHDNTGAARAGLHATGGKSGNGWELLLAHAVSYGIWLEVAHHGKYQIILPSLRLAMRELQQLIDGLWGRI